MPRKKKSVTKQEDQKTLFNYFRLGESYSSLILGIIVVIIGTVLLLSIARTRTDVPQTSSTNISRSVTEVVDNGKEIVISSNSESEVNSKADQENVKTPVEKGGTYKVQEGDDLWGISERAYESGYNWINIARANNLSNPDKIVVGSELAIPDIEQKNISPETEKIDVRVQDKEVNEVDKITSDLYEVANGDSLWEIALRAYGDGYKWTELAQANELSNPNLIHSGNKLKIPRQQI